MTFTDIQALIKDEINETNSTANDSLIQTLINTKYKEVLAKTGWDFTVVESTISTVTDTPSYTLPINYRQMLSVKVTVGGVDYYPDPIANEDQWTFINSGSLTSWTSDIPQYYFLDNGKIHIYPTPASANTVTLRFYQRFRDLVSTDFTDNSTGTVSITNGADTVAGSGTTFLSTDLGRHLRSDVDGFWYNIDTFTSTTAIELSRNFEGTTFTGSAFKIGTLPFGFAVDNVPEEGQMAIVYAVLLHMWRKREDMVKAREYKAEYNEAIKELRKQRKELYGSPTVNNPLSRGSIRNPNNYPTGLTK